MGQMKYRAVVFDLFGTLIPSFSEREYRLTVMQMANILAAPGAEFWELWSANFNDSILGILTDSQSGIARICQKLGINPAEEKINKAAGVLFEYEAETMVPRADAIKALAALKSADFRIGLISDCSCEAVAVWPETALAPFFDATVFSCQAGMRKPDPRIYRLALEQLKVSPAECCYIGDGSSRELSGAARAGLRAVQLRIPGEDDPDVYRIGLEDWQGESIRSLSEVLGLVGHSESRRFLDIS
jgi:putative hydrolase of the HAD superfamily